MNNCDKVRGNMSMHSGDGENMPAQSACVTISILAVTLTF